MPRLYRTVLVEILDNEKLGTRCSRDAIALFKDLFLLADDHGHLSGSPHLIRSRVFPYKLDEVSVSDVERWLAELWEVNSIRFYEVKGIRYLDIVGWSEHQRIQHPSKPVVPLPPDDSCFVAPGFSQLNLQGTAEESGASEPPIPTGTVENPPTPVQSQNGAVSREPQEASGESHEISRESQHGREGKGEGKETPFNPGVVRPSSESHETSATTPGVVEDRSPPSPDPAKPVTRRQVAKADLAENQRPEIRALCEQLADRIAADGSARPDPTKHSWHREMRLLVDTDLAEHGTERACKMVEFAIDWCQSHQSRDFSWGAVILSPANLREHWTAIAKQIRKQQQQGNGNGARPSQQAVAERTARRLAAAGRGSP